VVPDSQYGLVVDSWSLEKVAVHMVFVAIERDHHAAIACSDQTNFKVAEARRWQLSHRSSV